jgi:predicted permease
LLSGNGNFSRVSIPGRTTAIEPGIVNEAEGTNRNSAGDGLFDTLRIPIVAGRAFDARDLRQNAEVVVVDERFARQFFPNVNPVGRRFGFNPREDTRYEIIGVAGDSRYNSLRADARPTVYQPYAGDVRGPVHFAIRTTIDSGRLSEAVRKAVAAVDPAVPLTEFHTQTALIDRLLRTERLLGFISGAFGVVALTLAAVGLGGLLAYAVARRTNEIGIRMALGAASVQVTAMVLHESLGMVAAGIAIGLPCAYAVGRILKTTLFQLEPLDPRTAALSLSTLLITALAAAWLPARRAARIDPMAALREE